MFFSNSPGSLKSSISKKCWFLSDDKPLPLKNGGGTSRATKCPASIFRFFRHFLDPKTGTEVMRPKTLAFGLISVAKDVAVLADQNEEFGV